MKKSQAFNPYLPSWEFIPDGEPHVYGDRVYVYGSHDFYNGYVFCMGDYLCWSAPVDDLSDWRCDGVIYKRNDDPLNKEGKMCLYAPDVTVGPDGRYYLYYVLDKISIVSVAVCDTPSGKYEFLGYVSYPDGTRLGDKEGDEPSFDPAVLTEGDVTYLYLGFCPRGDKSRTGCMVSVLEKDMLTIRSAPTRIIPGYAYGDGTEFEGHAFFEAPSIRKFDDLYYFVYSSQVMHELCYAVSDSPTTGFTYGGVIVSNCDLGIDSYKPADMPSAYGADHLTIFWKIYCPICKPVFATIALFIAVWHWCSWFDNMIYNRSNSQLTTLQYELMKLLSSVSSQTSSGSAYGNTTQSVAITPTSIRAAATIVTSMPIVILYPFLQRYFVTGLTIGGVKE